MAFRIRQLAREEWALLRDLRLAALTDAPDQFGESYALASHRSAEDWLDLTLSDAPGAASGTFIAEVDNVAVGMAFAIQDRTVVATGRLGGMWVSSSARGIGIGTALIGAVLDWSRDAGMRRVRLWVVQSTRAEKLYRSARFIATGRQKPFPGDDHRSVIELQLDLAERN